MNSHSIISGRITPRVAGIAAILVASLILAISAAGDSHADATRAAGPTAVAAKSGAVKQRELYTAMRGLWSQHMEWTYATVVAFASDSKGLQPTIARLLANQKDIGNAIKPYYGKAAGNKLAALLTTHIKEAVPVLTAAKDGDTKALGKAVTDWYANAKEIGTFLAKANPAFKGAPSMLKAHIAGTITYASDELKGDYAKAITDYGKAEEHMLMFADELSRGIIKQFPARFR